MEEGKALDRSLCITLHHGHTCAVPLRLALRPVAAEPGAQDAAQDLAPVAARRLRASIVVVVVVAGEVRSFHAKQAEDDVCRSSVDNTQTQTRLS